MTSPRRPPFLLAAAVDLFYWLLVLVAWPVLLVMFLVKEKWREGFWQRMGFVPRLPAHRLRIWVHAISVGESEAARPLVAALREKYPESEIVMSTTTRTGQARAAKLFPGVRLFHYPLDMPWSVWMALGRIKPALVVQVEAEWWPNFLFTAARRGIPVCMVNVRITEKGVRGYQRIRGMVARMINSTTVVAVQNELYAERLRSLGGDAERIVITGQMKYDNVTFEPVAGADELATALGVAADERLVVAGSTAPGEDAMLLEAWSKVRETVSGVRLAIVPRKPEHFDEAARLVTDRGLPLVRRSQTQDRPAAHDPEAIIVGDTMGELMKFYQRACLVFIGRSLVELGGSNPIDPAGLGLPLIFGPHMFNFPEAEELFVDGGGAMVVETTESLAAAMTDLLQSAGGLAEMGRRGQAAIRDRQGATARNMEQLAAVIESTR